MSTRTQNVVLDAAAVLGAVCLVVSVACLATGYRPVVFLSGSMAPTITTGSLAFAREVPAPDLEVGDVVSVRTASGSRVTHRVIEIMSVDASTVLTLRGDANVAADAERYSVRRADRVDLTLPYIGYAVHWLQDPAGMVLLALLSFFLLRRLCAGTGRGRRGGGAGTRVGVATASALVVTTAVPSAASATSWTDVARVKDAVIKTSAVPAPVLSCRPAVLGLAGVTFEWPKVEGATSYTFFLDSGSAGVDTTDLSVHVSKLIGGGTATVVAHRKFTSTTWTSVASNGVPWGTLVLSGCK